LERRPEVGLRLARDYAHFLRRTRAEGDADIAQAPQRVQVEVELRHHAAEPSDIDDTPADRGGLLPQVEDLPQHLVDHQVHALAAGRFRQRLYPIRVLSINRYVGAILS